MRAHADGRTSGWRKPARTIPASQARRTCAPPRSRPHTGGTDPRYVTPGRRYLRLGGRLSRPEVTHRAAFLRELAEAAEHITDTELDVLLDQGGWRERKTAAWFIAVSDRTRFRDKLGALLLAGEGPYAGAAYCLALTRLGTDADAAHLIAYLDRYLLRPDLRYDQPFALGALLCLDEALGTGHATHFVQPHGLWQQYCDALPPGPGSHPSTHSGSSVGCARSPWRADTPDHSKAATTASDRCPKVTDEATLTCARALCTGRMFRCWIAKLGHYTPRPRHNARPPGSFVRCSALSQAKFLPLTAPLRRAHMPMSVRPASADALSAGCARPGRHRHGGR
ncbi:DUF6000 family protein [Amycolatopsis sp. NBC_01307]|uniref:DUF6000 family protein n=1 Tax=Amycolatopsis sp. NBC_01307 TaxID=2903561 RepID=UPI003FA36C87